MYACGRHALWDVRPWYERGVTDVTVCSMTLPDGIGMSPKATTGLDPNLKGLMQQASWLIIREHKEGMLLVGRQHGKSCMRPQPTTMNDSQWCSRRLGLL